MWRGCFATELGELLDEDQIILQTAITQNVKSQKGKGAELPTKNVEELNLVFITTHIYIYILCISKAGLFWSLSTY